MSTATKEPPEVYYPEWLDARIVRMADAVEAAALTIRNNETLMKVTEGSAGDGEATNAAREVWGAINVLKGVSERLRAIRLNPSEYDTGAIELVGELWDASYGLDAAAATLEKHNGVGGNAWHVSKVVGALADGLNAVGTLTDHRRSEAKGATS